MRALLGCCLVACVLATGALAAGHDVALGTHRNLAQCPNGKPTVMCFAQPCSVRSEPCPKGTTCQDDYCGGCNSFCKPNLPLPGPAPGPTPGQKCPNGQPIAMCFARPCDVRKEPCPKGTTCQDDYCGGCNSFCKPSSPLPLPVPECPADRPLAACFYNKSLRSPCADVLCPANKVCLVDYCGGCTAKCVLASPPPSTCPPGVPIPRCLKRPCDGEHCPALSKCVDNYCGGCKHECVLDVSAYAAAHKAP